jgi:Zinc carboxypeptidase
MNTRRRLVTLTTVVLLCASFASAQSQAPSPEQFFGFPMGTERKLAAWDKIVEYFQTIDRASDRVVVQELGKTTMGKPYIMAIVSSPDTIANLAAYQEQQKKLADPRKTSDEEAARIAREGKAVLLIGTNVHSTEIGNSQMVNKLLHKLATERSPWMDQVLKNVILLLIPSQNPDGQQMVVDWYNKNLGTPYEDSPLPELYHKYIGHDNNRDNYMLTQVETQHLTRVTYKDWLPEVYLDKHQMGSNRARIFVPPFKNPPNPNVDPLVWSEVNLLGQAMAAKLHEAGKTGVIWGEQYTGFWQGANSTNPWWHNMVALLTEVASSRLGTTLTQEMADPDRPPRAPAAEPQRGGGGFGLGDRDPNAPLPAPTDVQYRMNYTQPWFGGKWSLADVVDYQFISALGLLEGVANNKEMLKRNFHLMNKRAIDLYANGGPFAYLVPGDQRDPVGAAKLLQLVQAEAGEVHVAQAPFTADGREYPAGTHVMLLAQPFGRWIKDLLEPQRYPDIRWPFATAPIDRPYDVSAWTLGMLMGVKTVKVDQPFTAKLELMMEDATARAGRINGSGNVFVLNHEVNNSLVAMNRLLKDGADVSWAREGVTVNGRRFSPGAIVVRGARREAIAKIADELKVDVEATGSAPASAMAIRAPRLALYEPWGGNMDAGWTRWLLERHEFPYTHARNADLRKPDLISRFDVILFAEMSPQQILRGQSARNIRPEYKGGIGEEGVRNLRDFIQAGGTVITLGNAAAFAIEQLGVPAENVISGVDPDTFFCPGSLLKISVDTRHPIGFGMPDEAEAMFINNGGYVTKPSFATITSGIVARYPQEPLLRSGWIIGDEKLRGTAAVLDVGMGRGRVILHTFRVQSRAQTWGTFKLLFNSIFYGPAAGARGTIETSAAVAVR